MRVDQACPKVAEEGGLAGGESPISLALLTGGFDRPYAFGLAMSLVKRGICLEVIGSDDVDSPEMHSTAGLRFLNLQGTQQHGDSLPAKGFKVLRLYALLVLYAAKATPKLFHILWNNKLQYFDRTLLMLYFKLLGKKVVFTAHNVNAGKRDANDSFVNRLTLKLQYSLSDHIFVHTGAMKAELIKDFGISSSAVTIIPFGINNSVPNTSLTTAGAKERLGVAENERTILFFGNIGPYKGLDLLVSAFHSVAATDESYRLVIAGKPRGGCEKYVREIRETISASSHGARVISRIEYIPDEETELYFKAADVLVLPYREVFQSGVLFLSYSFGLPVIATDVGSFRSDIVQGVTGLVCRPEDPEDLARTIESYFQSELFTHLDRKRQDIRDYAEARNSWAEVSHMTRTVYEHLLAK